MKHCNVCQATYTDRVDFCFNDGAVLVAMALAHTNFASSGLDLPPMRSLRAAESDAPMPRARRRSLLGGGQREAAPAPPDSPLVPVEAPNQPEAYVPPEPPPPPPPLPWIDPPPVRGNPVETANTDVIDDDLGAPAAPAAVVATDTADPAPITDTPPPVRTRGATPPPAPVAGRDVALDDELPPPPAMDDDEPAPQPGRPAWMLPAIAGGVVGLIVLIGIGAVALGGAAVIGTAGSPTATPAAVTPTPTPTPPPTPEPTPAAPVAAKVHLDTTPPGATAIVDGEPRGVTPLDLELEPGDHTVRFDLEGHAPVEQALAVTADGASPPPFALVATAATPTPTPTPVATPTPSPTPVATPTPAKTPTPTPAKTPTPTPGKTPTPTPPTGWSTPPTATPTPAPTLPPTPPPPPPAATAVKEGKVLVVGAGTLSVDGRLVGPLPASVKLTEGKHEFTVTPDGGNPTTVTKEVVFAENGRAMIQL